MNKRAEPPNSGSRAPGGSSLASDRTSRTSSYRNVFRSTSVIGGANALVIVIRMVRAKAIALLIGPTGYGLAGLLQSTIVLVETGTGFGLRGAGVREVARNAGTGDENALGRTIQAFRIAVLCSGTLGAGLMFLFARQISRLTFGNEGRTGAVAVLSVVVLMSAIAQGQFSILQGLRRIRDLALASVVGAVLGTIAGIALLAVYGLRGIVPLIIVGALFSLLISWWFLGRAAVPKSRLSYQAFLETITPLIALGFTFLLTGLANKGMGYAARVIVGRRFGTEGVGLYSAAWGVSGMFVGFILQAMGTDFYPRLCAVVDDADEMGRLVNEQTTIGILMAIPGILFFLALAPFIIRLFYSAKFLPATDLLIFMLMGMAVRVVAWPLGYIKIAKMKNTLFLLTELGFVTVYIVELWLALPVIGLVGAGVGWFIAYLLLLAVNYFIGRKLIAFRWSRETLQAIVGGVVSSMLVLAAVTILPKIVGAVMGTTIATVTTFISFRELEKLLGVRILTVLRDRLFQR